jgi:hypothetical protein
MSITKWVLIVSFILSLIGCGGGGGGGGSTSTMIVVKVIDAKTDAVISGANITLTPTTGTAVTGKTDALGQFTNNDYPAGTSTVSVVDPKNAYKSFSMQINMPEGLSSYTVTLRLIPTGSTVPDTITLSPENPKLHVGDKQQFTATISPNNGLKPSWTFFGEVGTITANGLFTATALGTGTVIVQIGDIYATTLVTVEESGVTPTTGNVTGIVSDGSSALPGVTITLGSKSTTSNSIGYYSFTGVTPGSHAISASKTGYATATGNVTVTAGSTSTLNITVNPSADTVRLGKNRTITNFNYHDWGFENLVAPVRAPAGGSAQSSDDTATVSESRGPGSAQKANARVGADITWDLNGKTWAQASSTSCTVTFVFDYTMQAGYTDNTGYANARLKFENFDGTGSWYDRIGADAGEKGTRTRSSVSKTYQTTLAAIGNRISVLAQCDVQVLSTAPSATVNTSQSQVTLKSISITF